MRKQGETKRVLTENLQQYRQEAGKARTDGEKAALLGKADALQHECDAQNKQLQDQQNHNAKARQR